MMRSHFRNLGAVILVMSLLGLTGCHNAHYRYDFNVSKITDPNIHTKESIHEIGTAKVDLKATPHTTVNAFKID